MGREAGVGIVGHMDGVLRHIKKERLVAADGGVEGFKGFEREGFGEESAFVVIVF